MWKKFDYRIDVKYWKWKCHSLSIVIPLCFMQHQRDNCLHTKRDSIAKMDFVRLWMLCKGNNWMQLHEWHHFMEVLKKFLKLAMLHITFLERKLQQIQTIIITSKQQQSKSWDPFEQKCDGFPLSNCQQREANLLLHSFWVQKCHLLYWITKIPFIISWHKHTASK